MVARLLTSTQPPLTVPAMIEFLRVIHHATSSDIVLAGVSRTIEQAIDELTALRQSAMDVMCEFDVQMPQPPVMPALHRRRLC